MTPFAVVKLVRLVTGERLDLLSSSLVEGLDMTRRLHPQVKGQYHSDF